MDSKNILFGDCGCLNPSFQEFNIDPEFYYTSFIEYSKYWRQYLDYFKKFICSHKAYSIFNLSCGNKTFISVGLYLQHLKNASESFALLEELLQKTGSEQVILFMNPNENPFEALTITNLFKTYLDNQIQIISLLKSPCDSLSFDHLNRYFFLHSFCLDLIDKFCYHQDELFFADQLRELEELIGTPGGTCSDRRAIKVEDCGIGISTYNAQELECFNQSANCQPHPVTA